MIENIVSPNKKNSITGSSSSQSSSTNTSPQLPIFTSDLKKMNSSTSLTKTAASAKHDSDMDSGDNSDDDDNYATDNDNDDDEDDDQHNKILTPALFSNLDNKKRMIQNQVVSRFS